MFNRWPLLVRVPVRYGVIGGVIALIQLMAFYYMDKHPFLIPVFFDFRIVLFAVLIFFALKELRTYHFGGLLFFWQGVIASLLFTLVFASVAALLLWLFCSLQPGFVSQYIQLAISQIKTFPPEVVEQIGKDVYERNLNALPATDAFDLVSLYFVQSFGISFFISIILSVVLRQQPKHT